MKADRQKWIDATKNLKERRALAGHNDDNRNLDNPIRDYKLHLQKCGFGKSVLDVGCGSQFLRTCLPEDVKYMGLDAFPVANTNTYDCAIEDLNWKDNSVDTICAMAVLDNCLDFDKACQNMKRLAKKNIIILTGIGIEVDKYHTFKLEHEDFKRNFSDMSQTHYKELAPKVWLICYSH
jgi:ubiquinone/menaquinone biosynthesis C-methylase UbiE